MFVRVITVVKGSSYQLPDVVYRPVVPLTQHLHALKTRGTKTVMSVQGATLRWRRRMRTKTCNGISKCTCRADTNVQKSSRFIR